MFEAVSRPRAIALAVVIAVATAACGAREDKKSPQADADDIAQDNDILDQLRAAGSDLSKPHEIEFYLYVPHEADAEAAAEELRSVGYGVKVSAGPDNINWQCLASRKMMPTIDGLTGARVVFKRLAQRYNGAYGGWETAVEP